VFDKNELEQQMIEGYKRRSLEDSDLIKDFETTIADGLLNDTENEIDSNVPHSINQS